MNEVNHTATTEEIDLLRRAAEKIAGSSPIPLGGHFPRLRRLAGALPAVSASILSQVAAEAESELVAGRDPHQTVRRYAEALDVARRHAGPEGA